MIWGRVDNCNFCLGAGSEAHPAVRKLGALGREGLRAHVAPLDDDAGADVAPHPPVAHAMHRLELCTS